MRGLTIDGQIFPFTRNNVSGDFRGSQWTGATHCHDGKGLFAKIQTPGITFAITGPWFKGSF